MGRAFANVVVFAGLALALGACSGEDDSAAADRPPKSVVVYAAYREAGELDNLFARFTAVTGINVIVRRGDAETVVDDVIENRVSPAADLLLTDSVVGVSRAADEGALRPLNSQRVSDAVADWLRDPDGFWYARGYRTTVIIFDSAMFAAAEFADYAVLAEPRFRSQLCLSSFGHSSNRAVVATLIDKYRVRPAEIIVRGWLRNLAVPILESEQELLEAISAGNCSVAIASSTIVASRAESLSPGVATVTPADASIDIDAVGIARHARNPEGALVLAEWLLLPPVQARQAETLRAYPVSASVRAPALPDTRPAHSDARENVVRVARQQSEASKLAERARYQ